MRICYTKIMISITTIAEADARAKELIKRQDGLIPVVAGEPMTIEDTGIRYWSILYANPSKPDQEPEVLIGSSEYIADNGQILTFGSGNAFDTSFSFKDEFLRKYRRS